MLSIVRILLMMLMIMIITKILTNNDNLNTIDDDNIINRIRMIWITIISE